MVEKRSFAIDACFISKELVKRIDTIAREGNKTYSLKSNTKDVKADNVESFLGQDWPRNIFEIHIDIIGQLGKVVVDLNCSLGRKSQGSVLVTGSDATWVEGVLSQLKDVFKNARSWYWCIVNYWQIRTGLSAILVALLVWRLNRSLWFITSLYVSMPETSIFFLAFLVCFGLGVFPLGRFWLWIFPRYEFKENNRQRTRKFLGAIIGLIVTWILTNILLPSLIP